MFSFGISDFLLKKPSEEIGEIKTGFLIAVFSSIMILPLFIYLFINNYLRLPYYIYGLAGFASLMDVFAFLNFLKAMKIGELSIITPIVGAIPVVTVTYGFILLGERLSYIEGLAIVVLIIGILLVSTDLRKIKHIHTVAGIPNAFLSLFAWGTFLFLTDIIIDEISKNSSDFHGIAFVNVSETLFFLLFITILFVYNKNNIKTTIPNKTVMFRLLFIAFLFKFAWAALTTGFNYGLISIVSAVSSLSPAITVLLAQKFYHEKLVLNQKIGIMIILSGLILISL